MFLRTFPLFFNGHKNENKNQCERKQPYILQAEV